MNTARTLSRTSNLLRASLSKHPRFHPLAIIRPRLAHTSSHLPPPRQSPPLMKPIFWTVGVSVVGGIAYGLSRSTGRIGGRFQAREKTLNRQKWLGEGSGIDDRWLQ